MHIKEKHRQSAPIRAKPLGRRLAENKSIYLMLLPGLLFLIIVKYVPIYGVQLAFREFDPFEGVLRSPWIGLTYFRALFRSSGFWQIAWNTLILSFGKWVTGMPGPILFALLLNELRLKSFKKVVQTISYFPHFTSWVVVSYFVYTLFGSDYGVLNKLLIAVGMRPHMWYQDASVWRPILIGSNIWKSVGWGSILYLAAISGIPLEQYEAAEVDGAGRIAQAVYITLPSLLPIASILMILGSASLAWGGFDQVYAIIGDNPLTQPKTEILETYTYRQGLLMGNYSLSAAVGFLQNCVATILILSTNFAASKLQGDKRFVLF